MLASKRMRLVSSARMAQFFFSPFQCQRLQHRSRVGDTEEFTETGTVLLSNAHSMDPIERWPWIPWVINIFPFDELGNVYLHLALAHFAGNENYETAMASYVSAIITGSEYCTVNIQRQIDDYIIRRMIKCSSNLGCYLQAAILCQVSSDQTMCSLTMPPISLFFL